MAGCDFFYLYDAGEASENSTIIEIIDSNFINNTYNTVDSVDPFDVDENLYSALFFYIDFGNNPHRISVRNTTVFNNTGKYGPAVYFESVGYGQQTIEIKDSVFANNAVFSSNYYKKGTIFLKKALEVKVHNCSFINNSGTGLLLDSIINNAIFSGTNVFRGNKAYNGGGIGLYQNSYIYLQKDATLVFEDNLATNLGGGLYVKPAETIFYTGNEEVCFLSWHDTGSSLRFNNNSAKTAGNDLYGGNLYTCTVDVVDPGWLAVADVVRSPSNYTVELTSDPLRVCDCSVESTQNCINVTQTINTIQTYPGKMFHLSLVAVGQLINSTVLSGVPSAIYASLLPQNSTATKHGVIPDAMVVQNGQRTCTEFTYRINSTNENEVMVLAVNAGATTIEEYLVTLWRDHSQWLDHVMKVMLHNLIVPAYVEIHFLPCPVGFERSPHGVCVCSSAIEDFVTGCSIDTMLIERKLSYWIGLPQNDSGKNDNSSILYLTHEYCPFDYCRPGIFDFSLNDTDSQCSHHRSGILCGACKTGFSLILGGTECRQCTNIYLLLLIPFALAGLGLIVFLSLTDMTVASGTINGLLFYANILMDNSSALFPPKAAESFLSVFIAWLNLDLGISSCFYDGLDAYVYTWLQLAFPIYIWLLAFVIIIACRHVAFINKLCGTNIVPVLATLFLLSYTKLLNTITTSLSFTTVKVSNGEEFFVWLKDGNIPYLQGKHIALFLVNFAFSLILLAYTLSIVLGPWLQRKTQYRVFSWVLKLKPLFDAHFGPLKDQYRYWTGVLLLSRMILGLVSAVNVLGNDSINLLAIIIVNSLLLWQSGCVYKSLALSVLDSFFFVNLIILSSVTLFNNLSSGGSQYAAIFVSTGSAFAAFCAILLYHCFMRLKTLLVITHSKFIGTADQEDSDDDDLLDVIDEKREFESDDKAK